MLIPSMILGTALWTFDAPVDDLITKIFWLANHPTEDNKIKLNKQNITIN